MTTTKMSTVAMGILETQTWTGEFLKEKKGGSVSYTCLRLDYAVPEPVKKFLQYFQDMIKVDFWLVVY